MVQMNQECSFNITVSGAHRAGEAGEKSPLIHSILSLEVIHRFLLHVLLS